MESPGESGRARPGRGGPLAQAADTLALPYYSRLWLSNLIQFVCFQVQSMSLQWLVTSLTPSRTALGLLGFVQGGTMAVASPGAGVVVDRYSKRDLIVAGRLGIAAIGLGVAALVHGERIAFWHLLVAGVAGGSLAALMNPASQTYVFDVVGRARLNNAVALNAMGSSFGHTGGAALAGVLIAAIGIVGAFASASTALLFAAARALAIPIRGRSGDPANRSALAELGEGLAYVRSNPPVLLALVGCSMAIFNGAVSPMRPIFARHVLEVGSEGFGTMAASHGVGTIVAAVAVTLFPLRRGLGIWIVATMLAFAAGLLLYSFAFSFLWVVGAEFWLGLTGQVWNVAAVTGFQLAVPERMRGRVLALMYALVQLGFVGIFAAGALADAVGDQIALGTFGAVPTLILIPLLAFGWRTLVRM